MIYFALLFACISCGPDPASVWSDARVPPTEGASSGDPEITIEEAPAAPTLIEEAPANSEPQRSPPSSPDAITQLPPIDASSPITYGDLEMLVALAEAAGERSGANASADWIRSEGPHAPGPLGTTRAEFLDWMKTLAVTFGVAVGTAITFWLKRWLTPMVSFLGEQPRVESYKDSAINLNRQLAEQEGISASLRVENARLEALRLEASPLSARKDGPGLVREGVDFTEIGLRRLHGED